MEKEELTAKFPEGLVADIKAAAKGDEEADERANTAWEGRKSAFFESVVPNDFATVTLTKEQLQTVFISGYNIGWNDCNENIDSLRISNE